MYKTSLFLLCIFGATLTLLHLAPALLGSETPQERKRQVLLVAGTISLFLTAEWVRDWLSLP